MKASIIAKLRIIANVCTRKFENDEGTLESIVDKYSLSEEQLIFVMNHCNEILDSN